jgi:hypothetical protein
MKLHGALLWLVAVASLAQFGPATLAVVVVVDTAVAVAVADDYDEPCWITKEVG